jgi:multisubunit Na+/H+ antiporter MnhF subunit
LRRRRRPLAADRATVVLGVAAVGSVVALWAIEVSRVWRRGSAPPVQEAERPLDAAEVAVAETAEVARVGYQQASTRENAMFNMLTSFASTFILARWITYALRGRPRVGPFRDVRVGRRHIHHFVPGIVIAFAAGAAAILTRSEALEPKLAVPFGVGMGLTLDESALLLELDDVYWSREGLLSVQITLAVMAALASAALGLRFLRRGERVVLDADVG